MLKQSKIKNRKGSAMIIVIIAMALFLIVSITIMSQINNQIKSNSKIYKETQYKYKAEGEIDKNISEIYRQLQEFIDATNSKNQKKQTLKEGESRVSIKPSKEKETIKTINCYNNGDNDIIANINEVFQRGKNKNTPYTLIRTEIDSFNIESFKNLEMISIIDGKYKVTNTIEFSIDENFNLTYKVKSYSKGWIK